MIPCLSSTELHLVDPKVKKRLKLDDKKLPDIPKKQKCAEEKQKAEETIIVKAGGGSCDGWR